MFLRIIMPYKWGLIPFWAKDSKIGYSMINARAETVQSKPAFRGIFVKNRIVVIASGFYEWRKEGSDKQPFHVVIKNKNVLAFAGMYDEWKDKDGQVIRSATIITTEPNEYISDLRLHDRMPVILDNDSMDVWRA
jgi:putative SOS response-associated peptidase YedK